VRSKGLLIYWEWLMTLPPAEQMAAMAQMLHQLIIEIENLEAECQRLSKDRGG